MRSTKNFNPRAPCGARLLDELLRLHTIQFQPTRPLRGATKRSLEQSNKTKISTHAPLAGRDIAAIYHNAWFGSISTHAPLAGRDNNRQVILALHFISTHAPLAGRDAASRVTDAGRSYFNPRAPCGARRESGEPLSHRKIFQPTRPLRGATFMTLLPFFGSITFQPTRPLRGATSSRKHLTISRMISTHAPLAGRDPGKVVYHPQVCISTHAPLAGRD